MTFKELCYESILKQAKLIRSRLQDELDAEEDDFKQEQFEILSSIIQMVTSSKDELNQACLSDVNVVINDNLESLNSLVEWKKFYSIFLFSRLIEADEDLDIESEIDVQPELFKLSPVNQNLELVCFSNENTDFINSVGVVKFKDLSQLETTLLRDGFSTKLLAVFVHHLDTLEDLAAADTFLIHRAQGSNDLQALAALKIVALLDGKAIHKERQTTLQPNQYLKNRVIPTEPFNQFEETIIILSEINGHKGLLAKFLSLYHVIENFMFKIPLVNLCNTTNQQLFSVRDFRRLNEATADKEMHSITNFFQSPEMGNNWSRQVQGSSFSDIVKNNLNQLAENHNSDEIDIILRRLSIKGVESIATLKDQVTAKQYAHLVYKVRCSVVHNKETEFHISHFNLSDEAAELIEDCILRPLYSLVFEMLSDRSSPVWYPYQTLNLYQ